MRKAFETLSISTFSLDAGVADVAEAGVRDVGDVAPVANDDGVFDVIAGTSWVIDVLANDIDADSPSVEIVDATDGQYGTVVVHWADGTVTYTPDVLNGGPGQASWA